MTEHFTRDRIVTGSLCYVLRGEGENREVLLLKRSRLPQQGMWSAPGGKMELGESPDECVIREIHEETGLTIRTPTLRAIVTVVDQDYPMHWLLFVYRVEIFEGEVKLLDTEEGELCWIRLSAIADYPRPHSDQQHWEHVMGDSSDVWRGKFVYDTPVNLLEEIRYP
ncbi:MAG: NUDIX domain-containing protein [Aggregatilineales bacterium]